MHPMSLAAKANAEDNPTWEEAMNGPNREGHWEACRKELGTLGPNGKQAWEAVDRQPWMNVLPSTWAFKCKRHPDGSVRKLKARFCARGGRQIEGVGFFETSAPAINWQTVRLMLILSLILGLETQQVDHTAAFVHAPIDRDPNWDKLSPIEREQSGVCLQMPRGFTQQGKVFKLKKSLHGLKQSPRNFFQFLKGKLEQTGFKPNGDADPCLFISDKVICLVCVGGTLLCSPKKECIDETTAALQAAGMELEAEESVAGFLGVHIGRGAGSNTITLTQKGLANRVIEALNIGHLHGKDTPASTEPLAKDEHGGPPNGTHNCASAIGMLQHPQGHSRPGITCAASQCAGFMHGTRRSHEIALERIGQHLKKTAGKGLILNPSSDLHLDVHVDADFAGLWPHEDKEDPICVKSRTGFVVSLPGCPCIWPSKLQGMIALSTMEAECNGLPEAMKAVSPFQRLAKAAALGAGLNEQHAAASKTTVHEGNAGALAPANMEPGRATPRSKHCAIKMHWFRSHLKPNLATVQKIDAELQLADILTKGLAREPFQNIRKLLCGW